MSAVAGAVIGLDARTVEATPNGLGTYARQLVRALTRIDTSHEYIVIRRPDGQPPIVTGPNVREVFVAGDPSTPGTGGGIARLGLDLYHSLHHFLPMGLRVPRVVLTLHDLIWLEHRRLIRSGRFAAVTRTVTHVYARAAMGYAIRRADHVIAISGHSRTRALAYFGIDPSRIDVVHHGVEHAAFPAAAAPVPVNGSPYFLCLGNSRPYKNIGTALQAFAELAPSSRARLVVTGRGDATSDLQQLSRQLGVADRVSFTGPVGQSQLVDLLHGAVALIFPSLVEGFGLPVLEAMSAGCPVVASNCPTLVEVAGSGAIFCDPERPSAFADAMTHLLQDSGARSDLRQRGLARAGEFSWTRCAEETLAVYQRLLARAPGRAAVAN